MKKFFNKLAKTFIGIGTSVVLFCKKMYALAPDTITPLYGPVEPEPEYGIKYKVINGIFLILLPISAIITIIVGTKKYIKNSRDSKAVKILISIIALIVIVILIRVLVLGINNLLK